jgi:Tol biopolymer transport system component
VRRLLTAVVLAVLAAFPAAAQATWPGNSGRIAYAGLDFADEGALDGVYTIGPHGRGNHRVISQKDGGDLGVSRDGRRIAFTLQGRELWHVRSDGSQARRILRLGHGSLADPAWSPTGRRLVFTRTVRRHGHDVDEVWMVRRDGKRAHRLRAGGAATWSSKDQIAYATSRGAVATMRPSGRGRRIWVPQGNPVGGLDFSPNGRRLVYETSKQTQAGSVIRTVDLRTRGRTSFSANSMDVAWAPGGHRVAWATGPSERASRLRTARPNGRRLRTVLEFPGELSPFSFAWMTH